MSEIRSLQWWKIINENGGYSLTTSVDGGGTCTARAYTDKIVVQIACATAAKMNTSTINTPFGFTVHDISVNKISDEDEAIETLRVMNGASNISQNFDIATTGLIKRTTILGNATNGNSPCDFNTGDNDLIVKMSGTTTGTVIVVLDIVVD